MKRLVALTLTLCLALTCAAALAEGKLTVVQETYTPVEVYEGSFSGFIFAEVTNSGDENMSFTDSAFTVLYKDGKPGNGLYMQNFYPSVLAPGESGYIFKDTRMDDAASVEDILEYELDLSSKPTKEVAPVRLNVSATLAKVERWGQTIYQTTATVTNDTNETAYEVTVVFGLYDAEGKLIYSDYRSLYDLGIPAGQTLEVAMNVQECFTGVWAKAGVTPATVQAYAYVK